MDRQPVPVQMKSNPPITQGPQHIATEPPAWAKTAGNVIHYLMNDFGGGRRWFKLAWVINFQKLATIPLLAIFIFKYHNFNPPNSTYNKTDPSSFGTFNGTLPDGTALSEAYGVMEEHDAWW